MSVFGSTYDLEQASNRAKLDTVEELALLADQAGMSLVELTLRFVSSHPAVCSAICGVRTMDQLEGQLKAGGLALDQDLLAQIDKVVPPGHTISTEDVQSYNLATQSNLGRALA